MGKGVAWVNGNNIGRFWPSYMASKKNCTPCDYRGEFNADRTCNTGCGEPAQRWYLSLDCYVVSFSLHFYFIMMLYWSYNSVM